MRWQVPEDLRRRPTAGEVMAPAVLVLWSLLDIVFSSTAVGSGAVLLAGVAVAGAALVLRQRHPVAVLTVVGAALLAMSALGSFVESAGVILMLVVAVFACGRHGARPGSYLGVPLGMGIALAGSAANPRETLASSWAWSLNVVWIFGLGLWLNEADRRLVATRQQAEAGRRAAAAEERLRVARDLHDVLAHSLSLMVIQAEVADELFTVDPRGARDAVRNVQRTGRDALAETRRVLSTLRAPDSSERTPGVDDLPRLVELFRSAGLPVSLTREPGLRLEPEAGETVFRMVQEALTNALRHAGPQPTSVALHQAADGRLTVCVENGPGDAHLDVHEPGADDGGGGHGLVGMRERVEACGGRLDAGLRPDGGFRVEALLPTTRAHP